MEQSQAPFDLVLVTVQRTGAEGKLQSLKDLAAGGRFCNFRRQPADSGGVRTVPSLAVPSQETWAEGSTGLGQCYLVNFRALGFRSSCTVCSVSFNPLSRFPIASKHQSPMLAAKRHFVRYRHLVFFASDTF